MSRSNRVAPGKPALARRRLSALHRRVREINRNRWAEDRLPEVEELRKILVGRDVPNEIEVLIERTQHLQI